MKNLILIFTLLVSTVLLSSPSYAEWKKTSESVDGDVFYVDFDGIRKQGEYFYYWSLIDNLKQTEYGHFSTKIYHQADCKLFRDRSLSYVQHKQPMGRGSNDSDFDYTVENAEWDQPPPDSVSEEILKKVCSW